ncbi:MAG: sigma 54-interacting transcriptional regulator [Planctomycetota bacterium]|jgi:transcriptional regulator with PAS, ATPase and Fis domain|nr:sigma 54-interacting transcriptional regulator [Planctomycetota bacterium]
MISILVIAPYQKFADLFREVSAAQAGEVVQDNEAPRYSFDVVVSYDQDKIKAMRPANDVVIARGYSAQLLKRGGVPVVEVPVLPNDIIRCIRRIKERHGRRKVLFLATSSLTQHAESLSEILDWEIEVIDMPSSMAGEPETAFGKIRDRDCVVIGGQPVCALAEKLGYPHFIVESGPESMRTALAEAKRIGYIRRKEQEKAQSFKTILDHNADGIVALDQKERFTSINAMAEKILGISAGEVMGKSLSDYHPDTELCGFLAATPHCSDEVVSLRDVPLVVNKTPIFLGQERIGSVVTLQYVTKIQNSEKKIRNKITERGLVAKHSFADIQGRSAVIRRAIATARKYSAADAGVLIAGQSGTGKELFAQSIHNESCQRQFPFLAINCAAIPESLLESELFGYVEGAFTGASKGGKPGLIELAHRGTLFLDEIGEMPMRLQGRLLRVLQEKEIMRLGSDKVTHVSIRVISATNKELLALAEEGKFREDLYYRLAVLNLRLPSLDERREDIPGLARSFLESYAAGKGGTLEIDPQAMARLCTLPWPGNIRELRNTCEQLAVLSENGRIDVESVEQIAAEKLTRNRAGAEAAADMPPPPTRESVAVLLKDGCTRQEIARQFGISRSTLWRAMRGWNMSQ